MLLAGIVVMQVEVLKLSATMGRSIERGTALQSRNEQLRASVAQLSDDQRIESLAAGMGMVMPAPDAVNFLARHSNGNVQQALTSIHQPDVSGFVASLPVSDTAVATSASSTTTASGTSAISAGATAPTVASLSQTSQSTTSQQPSSNGAAATTTGG